MRCLFALLFIFITSFSDAKNYNVQRSSYFGVNGGLLSPRYDRSIKTVRHYKKRCNKKRYKKIVVVRDDRYNRQICKRGRARRW